MTRELSTTPIHRPAGRLEGRLAFITGAASGVGLDIAKVFHAEGAIVVATSLTSEKLSAALLEDDRLITRQLDVTDEDSCASAVAEVIARFARSPDVLVNNAGATIRGSIADTSTDLFASTIELNLGSAVRLTRLMSGAMRSARQGSIINMASITSTEGQADTVAYSSSKAGMIGMTRALAVEFARDGVRVNAISPTVIDTPMTHDHVRTFDDPDARYDVLLSRQPMYRMASARDVSLAALYLASDESSFITGINLPVDGGRAAA